MELPNHLNLTGGVVVEAHPKHVGGYAEIYRGDLTQEMHMNEMVHRIDTKFVAVKRPRFLTLDLVDAGQNQNIHIIYKKFKAV